VAFNLPHWGLGDGDPDKDVGERLQWVQENFEELISQTARRINASRVHEPEEALGEVTTTSTSYVGLTGGPAITVPCRPGLMIAVLMDVELKCQAGDFAEIVGELGTSATYVGGTATASTTYERRLSSPVPFTGPPPTFTSSAYPGGMLAVFPATATSHTITVKYSTTNAGSTASFKNRRIWAWPL
jgi:hypothetical protein